MKDKVVSNVFVTRDYALLASECSVKLNASTAVDVSAGGEMHPLKLQLTTKKQPPPPSSSSSLTLPTSTSTATSISSSPSTPAKEEPAEPSSSSTLPVDTPDEPFDPLSQALAARRCAVTPGADPLSSSTTTNTNTTSSSSSSSSSSTPPIQRKKKDASDTVAFVPPDATKRRFAVRPLSDDGDGCDPSVEAEWEVTRAALLKRDVSSGAVVRVDASNFEIVGLSTAGASSRDTTGENSQQTRRRLQQLGDDEESKSLEAATINQSELVERLKALNDNIARAWLESDRLNALRLAVKAARLLSDAAYTGDFYPTIFVLVTDIMNTLGSLVYDRILRKATHDDDGTKVGTLPASFSAADVRTAAQETCRNWFYKISAIRHAVPRIYMELALLRCYRFFQDRPPIDEVCRIARSARGVAHPVVASYLRCFIARRAAACGVDPVRLIPLMHDAVRVAAPVLATSGENSAISPALSWIAHCSCRTSESVLTSPTSRRGDYVHGTEADRIEMMLAWAEGKVLPPYADGAQHVWADPAPTPSSLESATVFVLPIVVAALRPEHAMAHAKRISKLIKTCGAATAAKLGVSGGLQMETMLAAAYSALGARISAANDEVEQLDGAALENATSAFQGCLKIALRFASLKPYLQTVAAWAGFASARLPASDLEPLLRGVVERVSESQLAPAGEEDSNGGHEDAPSSFNKANPSIAATLSDLYRAAVEGAAAQLGSAGVLAVAAEGSLGALADLLPAGEPRSQAAAALLDAALPKPRMLPPPRDVPATAVSDPVALTVLFESARIVHDAMDAMTPASELRSADERLTRFVRAARFPGDVDGSRELAFLARCRGAFGRCSAVLEAAVYRAAAALHRLSSSSSRGNAKKQREQLLAFAAFLQVTVPSLRAPLSRARAALLAAKGCHAAGLASRADACVELALAVVKEESAHATTLESASGGSASAIVEDGKDVAAERAACDATILGFAESAGGVLATLALDPEADPLLLVTRACRLVREHPWVNPADGYLRAARSLLSTLPALCQEIPPSFALEPGVEPSFNLLAREPAFCADVLALYDDVLSSCTSVIASHAASAPTRAVPARHAAALAVGAAMHLGGAAARVRVVDLVAEARANLPADERKSFVNAARKAGL